MNSPPKTALLAGTTGLIGSHILQKLLESESYNKVIALTRKPLSVSHPKLETVIVTLDTLHEKVPALCADDWYCALGTTIKQAGSQEAFRQVDYEYPLALGKQAVASGAEQFLLVTAIGSSANSSIFYSRVKGQLEQEICSLPIPVIHLFRPSQLLGRRESKRGLEQVSSVLMKGLNPVLLGPLRKYRAIQGEQVAAAMVNAASLYNRTGIQVYEGDHIVRTGMGIIEQ